MGDAPQAPLFFDPFEIPEPGQDSAPAEGDSHATFLRTAVTGAIRGSLDRGGTPPLVWCHLSHAYADGASLYFTFVSRARRGEEVAQLREVKTAACEAIVAHGGTITHHHAVGRDHAPYLEAEVGKTGVELLWAAKERLDPCGIMNPGKLLAG